MGVGDVGWAVVGHHPLHRHAERREVRHGPLEEAHRRDRSLVGEHFDVGEAGGVIDADVHVLPAGAAAADAAVAVHPVA